MQALKEAWEDISLKHKLELDLEGPARHLWAGTEAGLLGAQSFQGVKAGGDGSAHQGRMGAGEWCRNALEQTWSPRE